MITKGMRWGYPVVFDEKARLWLWEDLGTPADEMRPCPACDKTPVYCAECDEYHDACLGHLFPDVWTACCGHGVEDGWIRRMESKVAA